MKKQNTRRGFTQQNKVILNSIQDLQRLSLQLANNVRGRFQIKFGMTSLYHNGGFTLIELLVVVLIIGILAAVAVPQYELAIQKTRYMELVAVVNALAEAEEIYYLSTGVYTKDFDKLDIQRPISNDINLYAGFGEGDAYVRAFHNKTPDLMYVFYLKNHPLSGYRGIRQCRVMRNDETLKRVCQSVTGKQVQVHGADSYWNATY